MRSAGRKMKMHRDHRKVGNQPGTLSLVRRQVNGFARRIEDAMAVRSPRRRLAEKSTNLLRLPMDKDRNNPQLTCSLRVVAHTNQQPLPVVGNVQRNKLAQRALDGRNLAGLYRSLDERTAAILQLSEIDVGAVGNQ